MADLVFLKALRDKLKGGNTKSIHLNTLPGRFATRLDFANLNIIQPDLAKTFLQYLLSSNAFEFKISFDGIDLNNISNDLQKQLGLISKRLNSLYIENEDNYKEHGIKTFGFGYPILIKPSKQDPSKIIKAPLFIWQLELIKSSNKVNTWSILRNKTKNDNGKIIDEDIHSIEQNEVLASYLKTDEKISIPKINQDLLDDSIFDENELIKECYNILRALNSNTKEDIIDVFRIKIKDIQNIPDGVKLDASTNNLPWIYFGGVFGLYRTQKESIITDIDKLIENFDNYDFEDLKIENFYGTVYSAIDTDPSQQSILSTLGLEPKKIIQGPPGTGKSQSLTALITNALANNLKCLVVCEKKTALDVIKSNLNKQNEQLDMLVAVIEDINKDRDGIVSSVRDRLKVQSRMINFNQTNYNNIKHQIEQLALGLNHQHKQLESVIYQGKAWPEIVGEFLKRASDLDYLKLKTKLNHNQFKFQEDEEELGKLISKIKQAKKVYSEVNRLDHPLEILSNDVFIKSNSKAVELEIYNFCNDNKIEINEIKSTFDSQLRTYKAWLDEHYNSYYNSVKDHINDYNEFINACLKEFGDNFYHNNSVEKVTTSLLSLISKNHKSLIEKRQLAIDKANKIKQIQKNQNYFDHVFLEDFNIPNLYIITDNINKLNSELESWYGRLQAVKQDFLEKMSSKFLHNSYADKKIILENEIKYYNLLNKLNDKSIIKPVVSIGDNHLLKINEIDTLLSVISIIQNNLESFKEYFEWRKFCANLNTLEYNIIKSLIEIDCKNWETTFECWYYYWILAIAESKLNDLPKDCDKIEEFIKLKNEFNKLQINSIINNWCDRQLEACQTIQNQGINPIALYNKKGSRGERRNSLRKIINSDFTFFTEMYPVVMVSPSVCSSIIPLQEGIFDVVIFDEASQLRLEDTYPSLIRGKIKIVSGDSQQMPPSNFFQGGSALLNPQEEDDVDEESTAAEISTTRHQTLTSLDLADSESLLLYAENSNYKQSYLKVHYRSQHPGLIDFSNNAFYGKRLLPMPAKVEYQPIHFIEVNGIYEDQVNKDEAKQVVDILLNHINKNENGNYPSIGIATFNIYQRNLILDEISKARQMKPGFDKKMADIGSDLFVKNLENIQGDERDIIIISTTFGKRLDGTFRQNFGPIIQRNGYKLLNVIITRAKFKIYVCTSIPPEHYNTYPSLLQQFKNNGRAVLYSYIAYAKAISENNNDVKESILNLLFENCESKVFEINHDSYGSESPFEEEVYYRLAQKIGQERIQQQYKVGGFRIDLVIKSKINGRPVIALECDGAKYHSSNEAYAWDVFRQSQLEKQGFVFYRIWSTNWWNYTEKEVNKLVEFISNFDSNEKVESVNQLDGLYKTTTVTPIFEQEARRNKVTMNSIVTVKNPEGLQLKIKFSRSQSSQNLKPDGNGQITVYEKSPLASAIIGRMEGEICQLGMLEVYYEILSVEKAV